MGRWDVPDPVLMLLLGALVQAVVIYLAVRLAVEHGIRSVLRWLAGRAGPPPARQRVRDDLRVIAALVRDAREGDR